MHFERWIELGFPTGDQDVEPAALSNVQDIQADYSAQIPAGFVPDTSVGDEYPGWLSELWSQPVLSCGRDGGELYSALLCSKRNAWSVHGGGVSLGVFCSYGLCRTSYQWSGM